MAIRDLQQQGAELETEAVRKGKGGNVFDKLGNEGLLEAIEETKKATGAEKEEVTLLELAAGDAQESDLAKEPEALAPEDVAEEAVEEPDEELKAPEEEVEEEVEAVEEVVEEQPELLAAPVVEEAEAEKLPDLEEEARILEQQEQETDQVVEQQIEEPLEDAAELKHDAARGSREEVNRLIQRLASDPAELQVLVAAGDPAQKATQVVEYVASHLTDLDLAALAADGHQDVAEGLRVGAEAKQQVGLLSPRALQLGAFAPILLEMVADELARQPGADASAGEEEGDAVAQAELDPRRISPALGRLQARLTHADHG